MTWTAVAALALLCEDRCHAGLEDASPGMRARMRTLGAEIVSGRVHLPAAVKHGSATMTTRRGSVTERLRIDSRVEPPSLEYELMSQERSLQIKSKDRGSLEIVDLHRDPSGQATRSVQFAQHTHERLSLTVHDEQQELALRADSLWHLQLSHPDLCRTHLNPLLEALRDDWRLADTADAIEELLLGAAVPVESGRRQRWQHLVDELASDEFGARRVADRQLREAGVDVLPFLETLDRRQLDAEQWFRVRRIIRTLSSSNEEDSAQRVAARLANDPRVWHALLSRDDPACQQRAIDQLSRLLDEPFTLESNADARARLIEYIGRRIGQQGDEMTQ